MSPEEKLTPKQRAFCYEYVKNGGNAARAARDAGYSLHTAQAIGNENVGKPKIRQYIAELQRESDAVNGYDVMTLADIQKRRSDIARGKETDAFGFTPDFQSQLKAMHDLEKALKIEQAQAEKERAEAAARSAAEYHMDLYEIPDSFHAAIRSVRDGSCTEFLFKGGRGSTKSSTIAMIIIELLKNNHDVHAVVCRKVGNTLKDSVFSKIKWAISKQGLDADFSARQSPYEITLKTTGQKIYFRGADDEGKIKSIAPTFGYIGILWFEELDQFSGAEQIRSITQSVIRGGDVAWIFKSFNPPKTANNWANRYASELKQGLLVHHSTYLDVPPQWLGTTFINDAEHLRKINPNAYEHEYGGIANGSGGNVFTQLEIRDISEDEISHFDKIHQGVDWGWFPDQFAFLRTHYDAAREKIYLIDELYVNKVSNEQTALWIKEKGYTDYAVICDSAEPKSINDYRDSGIPARGAVKGAGSVDYGFKWLQTRTIVIDPKRTPNTYREITEYEYEKDRDGNVVSGYPDGNDHAISALRYAYEPIFIRRGSKA